MRSSRFGQSPRCRRRSAAPVGDQAPAPVRACDNAVRVLIVSARTRSNIDGIITSIEGGVVSMNDKEIAKLRAEREQRMRAPAKYLSAGASTPTHVRWRNSMFDQP